MSYKAYAVGVMLLNTKSNNSMHIESDHLCQIYTNLEDAQKSVLSNSGYMFENYYNIGLIEEITIIDLKSSTMDNLYLPKEWWYSAVHDDEGNTTVSQIEKPDCFAHISCFWVG